MAASDFTYADYLLYAGATNVNTALFAAVAHGVLGTLKNQFNIYVEVETLTTELFLDSTIFDLPATPVNTITSLTYDGTLIDAATYTWYGRDVVLTTALTDYRKPVIAVLEVGYTTSLPTDLKLAIYRHIDALIFSIDKSTDSIEKVINSTGSTTYYRDGSIPLSVLNVYEFYTARPQVLS